MAPVPLRPHSRLHNPRAIDAPAAGTPVQLHHRERPACGAVQALEAEPDKLVEHHITTNLAVGAFDPFLDLGHEPIDQLHPLQRRHAVGQQPPIAHRDPMLNGLMRATRKLTGGPITVRQRERFQDFHDLLVRLQLVPSGRLACLATTSRTGRDTTGADARSSYDFNEGRTTGRQWAELLATNGQSRDRLRAGSHGRRHPQRVRRQLNHHLPTPSRMTPGPPIGSISNHPSDTRRRFIPALHTRL